MTESYRRYLLTVLLLCLVFNKADGAAMGVMLQDIKLDLGLSDTQLGLLTGIAFTLFYSTMGIPIARWADRGNRVTVISLTTALQCGAVALMGAASNFVQLLLVRVGVAVGEAGCVPPANSLIADTFERSKRPRATAIFMLGYPLSALIGYLLGGWLNQHLGWRMTFVLLGVPGLMLAALAYFTLREPRLMPAAQSGTKARVVSDGKQTVAALWRNTSYRHLLMGYSLVSFFGIGVILWVPTFLIRTFAVKTAELGLVLALIWGIGGGFAGWLAGTLADRYAKENEVLQVKVIAALFLVSGAVAAGIFLAPSLYVAYGFLTFNAMVNYGTAGPLFATIQTLFPEHMRAVAVANVYLMTNLIGIGLGPLAVGAISDGLRPSVGDDSLRYALLVLCPGYVWAAWHLWRASRTVERDVQLAGATA